jgi:hypothetical protein
LGRELSWHCDAYWPDDALESPPTLLVVSIKAQLQNANLRDVRLTRVDALTGSGSSFMAEDWLQGNGFNQRSAKMNIALRHEGFRGSLLTLSGTWYEKSYLGETGKDFVLQGDLVETGIGEPPALKVVSSAEAKCNVQHIARQLEELLMKLADGRTLAMVEVGKLQELTKEYWGGDCGGQTCRPGSCAFRQPHTRLAVTHRYKDIADVLSYPQSGISDNPPKLRIRHGVESLGLPVRLPGSVFR